MQERSAHSLNRFFLAVAQHHEFKSVVEAVQISHCAVDLERGAEFQCDYFAHRKLLGQRGANAALAEFAAASSIGERKAAFIAIQMGHQRTIERVTRKPALRPRSWGGASHGPIFDARSGPLQMPKGHAKE